MKKIEIKKILRDCTGTTLVEVLVTMLISGIAISGLALAYADGLRFIRRESSRTAMIDEANAAMRIIWKSAHFAYRLQTRSSWREPSTYLSTKTFDKGLSDSEFDDPRREFFYFQPDRSLRWNDFSGDVGRFNLMLIPRFDYDEEQEEPPYIVVEQLSFTPVDPNRPQRSATEGFVHIKVDMKLRSAGGDSLLFSEVVSKFNVKKD